MRSDPRIGLAIALAVAAIALLWLLVGWLAADAIWTVVGSGSHAITLLAIFLLLVGLAVALLFRRFWRVKSDLLSGRNVIAQWVVDGEAFKAFASVAEPRERAEKRGALMLMGFFVAVIFGAFALFDPQVALPMLAMAALLVLILAAAYVMGRRQLEPGSGEVIVGTDGALVNDVLHVWGAFPAWLANVELEPGPGPILTISYAVLVRFGPRYVSVMMPVPPGKIGLAEEVERRLRHRVGKARRRTAKRVGPATGSHGQTHRKGGRAAKD